MHNYLVQKLIGSEVYGKIYTETELINSYFAY